MGKGRVARILCMAICGIMTLGCTKKEVTKLVEEKSTIVVGFSLGTLMEDRWIRDRDIFISMAEEEGIEVIVNNANRDSDLQYQQVMEMLNQDIDVLVIAPNDSEGEARCVKAAKEKDIPVISYDRLVYNSNVDAYISFDNRQVGELMASYLVDQVPEGGYLLIHGSEDDSNSDMIHEGWMNVLQPHIDSGEITVLGETWVNGWKRELSFEFVSSQVKDNKEEIRGILCGNDSLAWGAIDALSEAQISEQVQVTGQDADLVACQRIATGKQSMTIYKPIQNLVAKTVEVCLQLIHDKEVKSEGTINDGTYDVPYIYIGVEKVTKETLEETVIKDGFHLYEDIYETKEK